MKFSLKHFTALVACALAFASFALAQVPFTTRVTMPGVGAYTNLAGFAYTQGVNNASFSAYKLSDIWVKLPAANTNSSMTIKLERVRAGVTNTTPAETLTIATNLTEYVWYATNTMYWFRGDTMVLRCSGSYTNIYVDITGLEQ
jgi:hypothetical protein